MRTVGTRFALFVFGTPNIIGCLLALVVLLLFFTGFIRAGWWMLTLGAYLFGWLAAPRRREVPLERLQQLKLDEAINAITSELGPRLPVDARSRLTEIQALIHELAPRLDTPNFPVNACIELNNAITRDLPATLANYLALPPSFARLHPVAKGKTAKELLLEQLDLLFSELSEIANGVYAQDADKLVSQGEYLKQKFQSFDFLST